MHNGKDSQQIPRWLQYIDGDGLIYELTLFSSAYYCYYYKAG
jgi:hypothetical protein